MGDIEDDVEAIAAWHFAPAWTIQGLHTLAQELQTDAAHCKCGALLLRTYARDANNHQVLMFATSIEDTETQEAWEEHYANMQADEAYGENIDDEANLMLIDMNPGEIAALKAELPQCLKFFCYKHRGANCGPRVREYDELVYTTKMAELKRRLKTVQSEHPNFYAWLQRVALPEQFPVAFRKVHKRSIGAITTQVRNLPVSSFTFPLNSNNDINHIYPIFMNNHTSNAFSITYSIFLL